MTVKKAPIAARNGNGKVRDDFVKDVDGTEVRLPSLSYLKPGLIRKIRNRSDIDAMYTLLEEALDEKTLKVLDDMDPDLYAELIDEWREHSGVSLGES